MQTPSTKPTDPAPPGLAPEEKQRRVAANESRLLDDLWRGRLEYASRPRIVDMQLSNICNMSCTMCYDGVNPAPLHLPQELVERVGAEVLPDASVLVPFSGSEPLIVTWDQTRSLAQRYQLELDIVTNVQFLDEEKFAEMEPHVSTVAFSIDSHLPDVYEAIRLRSKPDKVFANLPVAARLCREHGIEAQANIVFMTENAPFLDDTVAYLADIGVATVRILKYIRLPNLSEERDFSDASQHFSPRWIEWMKSRIRRVAAEKRIRVIFDLNEKEFVDHLPKELGFRPDPKPSPYIDRLRLYYPGYCWQSVDRIKVMAQGDVYPCCMGDSGQLQIGNLNEQSFEEIWNGPESRDLRRGMMTDDVPSMCKECSFHTAWFLEEQPLLALEDWYLQRKELSPLAEESRTLVAPDPPHMTRTSEAPLFRWESPAEAVDRFDLVLALGGEFHEENVLISIPGTASEYRLPEELWNRMRSNAGWWWNLFGVNEGDARPRLRSQLARCLIRHEPIARIPESTLEYDAPQESPAAPRS